jgi:hypothetical protein
LPLFVVSGFGHSPIQGLASDPVWFASARRNRRPWGKLAYLFSQKRRERRVCTWCNLTDDDGYITRTINPVPATAFMASSRKEGEASIGSEQGVCSNYHTPHVNGDKK